MGRAGGGGGRAAGGGGGRSSGGRSGGSHRAGYNGGGDFNVNSAMHMASRFLPRSYGYGYSSRGSMVSGIMSIVLVIAMIAVGLFSSKSNSGVTPSTVVREPLQASAVTDIGYYYDDQVGWIHSATKVNKAMKHFQAKTGVAPVLVISDYDYSSSELGDYASAYYEENISDEAHLVFVFNEYNEKYTMQYVVGSGAKAVLDTEAMDILMDYIEQYYYSDMTEDEVFGTAFTKAADRMMSVTKSPIPVLIGLGLVLAIVVVVFFVFKAKAKRDKERAEETERILNTDIEDLKTLRR